VLPGDRTFVGLPGNVTTGARTGLVRHRGGTGAEAVSSGGLTHLAIFDALRARVFNPVSLRVVASGSAETSTVDYRAPVIAVDLPDGRSVQLDQAGRSFDFALPGPGNQAMPGMPVLPSNTLTELLAAVPGGAAAVPLLSGVLGNLDAATGGAPDDGAPDDSAPDEAPAHAGGTGNAGGTGTATGTGTGDAGVPESAGSAAPPMVPGIPELGGVPAVGGLLGGTGRLATTANQGSLVLRLTGGEVVKEVADSGVHAKAISLRVKLLLVRGEDTATLVDLCIGVLEVAATAPSTTRPTERGRDGYGGEAPDEEPSASPSPSPVPPAGEEPDGGGKLPVTGTALTAATGAGVVLLLAGRLLMVLARRRSPTA
jgi:hypothetical protein